MGISTNQAIGTGVGAIFGPVGAAAGFGIGSMFGGDEEESKPTMLDYANMTGQVAQSLQGTSENIAPQQAQLQLDMLKQFGLPIGQEYQRQFAEMNPYQSQLGEALAEQSLQGIGAGLTPNELRIVQDAIRGTLGDQSMSGLGINRLSGSILQATQNRQNDFRNMGLSLNSRTPMFGGVMPNYTDFASQANFGQIAGLSQQQNQFDFQNQEKNPLFALGGAMVGGAFGGPAGASVGASIGNLFA